MKKLRVVLADDHAMIRAGVRALIEAQPDMEVVAEASVGHEAIRLAQELQPDVMVLDISMPKASGLEAMGRVKKASPSTQVLVLTAFGESAYLRHMLAAGATGYLLKQSAADALIEAIRTVSTGTPYLDPSVAGKVIASFAKRENLKGEKTGELTEREREVAIAVARGHTNKEIAGTLSISVKTVESHKANLMQKLDLGSRADVVRYALQQGWLERA